MDTRRTRTTTSGGCAGSRGRSVAYSGWSRKTRDCIGILTQVSAVTRALESVALGLLEEHLSHCVAQAIAEGGDTAAAKIREASDAVAQLVRS